MTEVNKIASLDEEISREEYGGKAFWLSWLARKGFNVPDAIFLPAVEKDSREWVRSNPSIWDQIQSRLDNFKVSDGKYDLAIRSSATCEDMDEESLAGHFDTIHGRMTKTDVLDNIENVISSLGNQSKQSGCRMGVILQERIDASYSGVVFSSNPLNGKRNETLISFTEGMGDSLVAGEVSGTDIMVRSVDGGIEVDRAEQEVPFPIEKLESLHSSAKEIETTLGHPVDIEWCVGDLTDNPNYLQCRPDTGILHQGDQVIPIVNNRYEDMPRYVQSNDKVQMRMQAEEEGIFISNGNLIIIDCSDGGIKVPDLSTITPSQKCEAYAAVLIHPETVAGEVKRSFLPHRFSVREFIEKCQRYLVRSYPDYDSLEDHIRAMAEICCDEYWNPVVAVQEVFDPEYTGIIQKTEKQYIIELGLGHFVPKGVVATSQYMIDFDGELVHKFETTQERRFLILDGYVIKEDLSDSEGKVAIEHSELNRIIEELNPILNAGNAVEFGLLESVDGYELFVIDFVEEKETREVSEGQTGSRVISSGTVSGRLTKVEEESLEGSGLDMHFRDETGNETEETNKRIFHAKRPDISLLELIEDYPPNAIGFIFEDGSILCHLAIILREQNIPAVIQTEDDDLQYGENITLRADPKLDTDSHIE